ncbi:intermembrane space AAA protease IAP protein [Ceratobasidium sp. AG-Ba]|nr:intermembrane space AAA protease IAP protein [Ceratobasidium sp. AG-Ba]QRW01595.1 intermembrane space AAA protease IAP protein [Ceratobasidium sp. AG-Ba]
MQVQLCGGPLRWGGTSWRLFRPPVLPCRENWRAFAGLQRVARPASSVPSRAYVRPSSTLNDRFHHTTGSYTLDQTTQSKSCLLPRFTATGIFASTRSISLFRSKPAPVSPVLRLAKIARLEADADAHAHDPARQVALFMELAAIDSRTGYQGIVSRWERMCEFDPRSPLLRSDTAFELYLTSLIRLGLPQSVNPAVRRREALLALPPPAPATPETPVEPVNPPSASEVIAQRVLNNQSIKLGVGRAILNDSPTPLSLGAASGTQANETAGGNPFGNRGLSGADPVHVVIEEPKSAVWMRLFRFILIAAVYGFIALTVLAFLLENSGLLKAGRQSMKFEPQTGSGVKFSDVHGVDEAKEELSEVVKFLKDPAEFTTLGGRLPKGVLLTGPPGTGKTLLAKAVAGEAGVPFLYASGSEFDEMYVGVGAKRVRELFETARKQQPSIIFIDELDAVGGRRNGREGQWSRQTLNQLLTELDGFSATEGVIVIAATNYPESLDNALVRPGRFDKKVAVPLPDIVGRTQILAHHMKGVKTDPEVDIRVLARGTPGFSGADLQNMVNQAAIQASRVGHKSVGLKEFEWAKDKILMGAERKSSYITPKDKLMTAYHEAGHALTALFTPGARSLHKVTCMPRGHALGLTQTLPEGDEHSVSFKQFSAMLDVSMGGRIAEEMIYGKENVTSGASSDIRAATNLARRMEYGYSDKVGTVYHGDSDTNPPSPETSRLIESEIQEFIRQSIERTTQLLESKSEELHKLAQALVEHETLDKAEVEKVIRGEKIRQVEDKLRGAAVVAPEANAKLDSKPQPSRRPQPVA